MKSLLYVSIFSIIAIKSTYASPPPVIHSHEGRTHRHVLPNNGIGNHNHNSSDNNKSKYKINERQVGQQNNSNEKVNSKRKKTIALQYSLLKKILTIHCLV
jgi:hypothetical protein